MHSRGVQPNALPLDSTVENMRAHIIGRAFEGIFVSTDPVVHAPIVGFEFGDGMAIVFRLNRRTPLWMSLEWDGGRMPPRDGGDVDPGSWQGIHDLFLKIEAKLVGRRLLAVTLLEDDGRFGLAFDGDYFFLASGWDAMALAFPSTIDPKQN